MSARRAAALLLFALAAPAAAGSLPAEVRPLHYQLTVTPDFGTRTFAGDLTIDLEVVAPTTRITLDAVDLEFVDASLTVPGRYPVHPTAAVDAAAGTVTFTLPARLLPGTAKLRVEYDGRLNEDGRGFYLVRTADGRYLLSQMESSDARRAFPCVDQPAAKASFALTAVVDDGLTAISNGPVVSDTPGPKAGQHAVRFGTTPKMASYLVALAVGRFECAAGTAESIPIRVCTRPGMKDLSRFALEASERAFAFDNRYVAFHYPFRKLDLVAVPGNFPGAMENAGAIVFDEGLLASPERAKASTLSSEAAVLSHEIAHQWFGNVVTMASWDDLWLNEGFATWMAARQVADWKPQWNSEMEAESSVGKAMRLDALTSTRPVRAPVSTAAEIDASFDEIAYDKGGAIVGMLEAWLGPDVFRKGLTAFVHAHAFGAVTTEDLASALHDASGQPVAAVLAGFVSRPGVPEVRVEASCAGDETVVTATARRFSADGTVQAPDAAWTIPLGLRGLGGAPAASASSTVLLAAPTQTFRLAGCFPAVFANSGARGYYYTSYASEQLSRLASAAERELTPVERLRLLEDAWDLALAGRQAVGDYMSVAAALAADPAPAVVEELARELAFARDDLVPVPERPLYEAWVTRVFAPVWRNLGWAGPPGEPEDRLRRRRAVLDILGRAGRDKDVLATARAMIDAHLAGRDPIPLALMPVVVRLVTLTADPSLLPRLRELDEQEVLRTTPDTSFVLGVLTRNIAGTGGHNPWPEWLSAALDNPSAQAQAFTLVVSRWSEVREGFADPLALSALVTEAGRLCDGESRDSVKAFFADKTAAIPRTLRLTLDRIDACRDSRLRVDGPLSGWLKSASSRTPPGSR